MDVSSYSADTHKCSYPDRKASNPRTTTQGETTKETC